MMQITFELPDKEFFLLKKLDNLKGYGLAIHETKHPDELALARELQGKGLIQLHMITLTEYSAYLSLAGSFLMINAYVTEKP
jgi:hypothetical protein